MWRQRKQRVCTNALERCFTCQVKRNRTKQHCMKLDSTSILCMSESAAKRTTVRRHYLAWRKHEGLPERCDNPSCKFFIEPLRWNGQPLPFIVDHISGNSSDNRTDNLRLLCPNCDSQNKNTRGGANAGRIERLPGGSYHEHNRDGTQNAYANGVTLNVQVTLKAGTATTSKTIADTHHDDARPHEPTTPAPSHSSSPTGHQNG